MSRKKERICTDNQVQCVGAHRLRGALSQRGLLDPIKLTYNQSQPYGWLKLTASASNRLWISMPAVWTLVPVSTVTHNSLHLLSASSITARRSLDFMVQEKTTDADTLTIHLDATPPRLPVPNLQDPIFTPSAFSAATFPICPGLGQAQG